MKISAINNAVRYNLKNNQIKKLNKQNQTQFAQTQLNQTQIKTPYNQFDSYNYYNSFSFTSNKVNSKSREILQFETDSSTIQDRAEDFIDEAQYIRDTAYEKYEQGIDEFLLGQENDFRTLTDDKGYKLVFKVHKNKGYNVRNCEIETYDDYGHLIKKIYIVNKTPIKIREFYILHGKPTENRYDFKDQLLVAYSENRKNHGVNDSTADIVFKYYLGELSKITQGLDVRPLEDGTKRTFENEVFIFKNSALAKYISNREELHSKGLKRDKFDTMFEYDNNEQLQKVLKYGTDEKRIDCDVVSSAKKIFERNPRTDNLEQIQ